MSNDFAEKEIEMIHEESKGWRKIKKNELKVKPLTDMERSIVLKWGEHYGRE